MADLRLHNIYMAAGRLFNTKGYAGTKVAEIASEAGIATGSIYNLFTGKKAILTFVIRACLDRGYLDSTITLPIEETNSNVLMKLFKQAVNRVFNEVLNITDENHTVNRGFMEMISDLFDVIADYLLAFNNIEYNAAILKELADEFFPVREKVLKTINDNLEIYIELGEIRKLEYPIVHVQSINDILTWWAMNAYIAMPDVKVPRETAKKIAVDLLAHAYLKKYE